jgi:hypothetical protein
MRDIPSCSNAAVMHASRASAKGGSFRGSLRLGKYTCHTETALNLNDGPPGTWPSHPQADPGGLDEQQPSP